MKNSNESKVLLIDRTEFLDWYFDYDTSDQFFHEFRVFDSLKETGTFSIDANNILDNCGYMPDMVVHESQRDSVMLTGEDSGEVDLSYYDVIKFAE